MNLPTCDTHAPAETLALGRRIGAALEAGDVVGLIGDLGAGKTQLVKGIAVGLGLADAGVVTSPTFVLMNTYAGRLPLRHYDLYRIEGAQLESLAFHELRGTSASVVEWADRARDSLEDWLEVAIEITGETSRRFSMRPHGVSAERLLARFKE